MVVNSLAVYNSDAFWSFPNNLSPLRATEIDWDHFNGLADKSFSFMSMKADQGKVLPR